MLLEFFGLLLLFLMGMYLLGYFAVAKLEPQALFHPTVVTRYDNLSGSLYPLDSGGAVLHYSGIGHDAILRQGTRRKILFLHGNTGHLGFYAPVFELLFRAGYDVYALEYIGFGVCNSSRPTLSGVMANVQEAWTKFGDAYTILMGFSIGGILIGQWYDRLVFPARPAQLVFLNTFASLPAVIADVTHEQLMYAMWPFLATANWVTLSPVDYRGRVLIVGTQDDPFIKVHHSKDLARVFAALSPTLRIVASGGHEVGPFYHFVDWQPDLLPPVLT